MKREFRPFFVMLNPKEANPNAPVPDPRKPRPDPVEGIVLDYDPGSEHDHPFLVVVTEKTSPAFGRFFRLPVSAVRCSDMQIRDLRKRAYES